MSLFKTKTLEQKLNKAGLVLDASRSVTRGNRRLTVRQNGTSSELSFVCIANLQDPDRAECDYFTSYYPSTIKAAIAEMFAN